MAFDGIRFDCPLAILGQRRAGIRRPLCIPVDFLSYPSCSYGLTPRKCCEELEAAGKAAGAGSWKSGHASPPAAWEFRNRRFFLVVTGRYCFWSDEQGRRSPGESGAWEGWEGPERDWSAHGKAWQGKAKAKAWVWHGFGMGAFQECSCINVWVSGAGGVAGGFSGGAGSLCLTFYLSYSTARETGARGYLFFLDGDGGLRCDLG